MRTCDASQREVVAWDKLTSGVVVHTRSSTTECDEWLLIGKVDAQPPISDESWRIMEVGKPAYKDYAGTVLGHGNFTGRTSTLHERALRNFHIGFPAKETT